MCGRFYISEEEIADELLRIVGEAVLNSQFTDSGVNPRELKTCGEVFPSDYVPVCEQGEYTIRSLGASGVGFRALGAVWGFPINGTSQLVINARAEAAADRAMFQRARPCVVPATNYFEWEVLRVERPVQLAFDGMDIQLPERVEKRKRSIRPNRSGFFYMAGLIRHLPHMLPDFTIVTIPAAKTIEHIHDRMPSILSPDRAREWLSLSKFSHDFIMDSSEREVSVM